MRKKAHIFPRGFPGERSSDEEVSASRCNENAPSPDNRLADKGGPEHLKALMPSLPLINVATHRQPCK